METIRYGLISRQDLRLGRGTFETTLGDGRVVMLDELNLDHFDAIFSSNNATNTDITTLLTLRHTTTGTPAAGIGTRLLFQGQSANVNPSDLGALEFAFDDVTASAEKSTAYLLLRRAGNDLSRAYGFRNTGNFNLLFSAALTATRTLTLPDATDTLIGKATTDTLTNKTLDTALLVTGTGSGTFKGMGTQNVQTGTPGTPANLVETDLFTYTLPANSLAVNGQAIEFYAYGNFSSAISTKTVRLYFGGVVVESNDITTAPSNSNWMLHARVLRTGPAAETSIGFGHVGSVLQTVTFQPLTSDTAATITLKVTGQNGTANANEIQARGFLVKYLN